MITPNMTAGTDSNLIWFVRISLDGSTLRFCDRDDGITLSSNVYSGAVLHKSSWDDAEIDKSINVSGGGSSGSVGNFIFSLTRYSGFTGVSQFFNDFYPSTSEEIISARTVELGYGWEGISTESQITWDQKFYVFDYIYNHNVIELTCLEGSDLQDKTLPYYKVQKDYDDRISYWTKAEENEYGSSIPILYGDFAPTQFSNYLANVFGMKFGTIDPKYAPGLIVGKNESKVLVASHPVHTAGNVDPNSDYYLFRYIDSIDSYMRIAISISGGTSGVNTEAGHYFTMQPSSAASTIRLLGELGIRLERLGSQSDIQNIDNMADDDSTNYIELDALEYASLMPEGSVSNAEIGTLGTSAGDIATVFTISGEDANNRDYGIAFFYEKNGNPTLSTTDTSGTVSSTTKIDKYHYYGNTNKPDGTNAEPYDAAELSNREYAVRNTETTAGDKLRVYSGWLLWQNITVLLVPKKGNYITTNIPQLSFQIRGF